MNHGYENPTASIHLDRRRHNRIRSLLPTLTFLLVALIMSAARPVYSEPDASSVSYHPFRSLKAKEAFLLHYDQRAQDWPVPSESINVETSYGPTFVRISGSSNNPPLVLLHGIGGNSLQWAPNIKNLSRYFKTYAVDNIYDYGRSVYTKPILDADDFTSWLNELFDGLGLTDGIAIMGLSYGGWLAAEYAHRFPERLAKIVLLAPAGFVLPFHHVWMKRAILCLLPWRYFTKSFLYWMLSDLVKKDDTGRKMVDDWVDESFLASRSFKFKPLVDPKVWTDDQLRALMIPTLFMVGENEKIYSGPKAIKRLSEAAPQIKTILVPNAGHDLTVVQSDMINRAAIAFLNSPEPF